MLESDRHPRTFTAQHRPPSNLRASKYKKRKIRDAWRTLYTKRDLQNHCQYDGGKIKKGLRTDTQESASHGQSPS